MGSCVCVCLCVSVCLLRWLKVNCKHAYSSERAGASAILRSQRDYLGANKPAQWHSEQVGRGTRVYRRYYYLILRCGRCRRQRRNCRRRRVQCWFLRIVCIIRVQFSHQIYVQDMP